MLSRTPFPLILRGKDWKHGGAGHRRRGALRRTEEEAGAKAECWKAWFLVGSKPTKKPPMNREKLKVMVC